MGCQAVVPRTYNKCSQKRWHRLVKNIGVLENKILGHKVVRTDENIGISQLLGGTCPGWPQGLCLCRRIILLTTSYDGTRLFVFSLCQRLFFLQMMQDLERRMACS